MTAKKKEYFYLTYDFMFLGAFEKYLDALKELRKLVPLKKGVKAVKELIDRYNQFGTIPDSVDLYLEDGVACIRRREIIGEDIDKKRLRL